MKSSLLESIRYVVWRLSGYGVFAGYAIAVGGPALLLGKAALAWLQTGIWRDVTNADAIAWLNIDVRPALAWVELQRLAVGFLNAPFWCTALVGGAAIFYAFLLLLERTEPNRMGGG